MTEDDLQVVGELFGNVVVATARCIGDLAIALGKQPGIDADKLIADFLEQLPSEPDGLGGAASMVEGLRVYLGEQSPTS